MEYEEFLVKMAKREYLEIYDNLDIEKMKKIVQENIDYLIKLKGKKAIEEIINNDKLIEYFQWLVKEKTILYIPKEFIIYIYLIKERFGGKVLEDLISMLIKYEEIFQISTTFIIETIGKNIENLDKERMNVLLEILEYLINEKYKLKITIYTALSESLNLILDKDTDIKIARDFIIKVIGSFGGRPYLIIKLKDSISKNKFVKLLNIFSSNGLYYKVQNEEDIMLLLNQVVKDPSIIDLIGNINFEKIKSKDFLFVLTKYFENIYFNEKINQEIKLEIFNQLINKGGRIVRYIIIHTDNKKYNFIDYGKLYNVINLMGKDLFIKYPNILKYYPQFVSFRLYRLIKSEKDLEYLENELNKRDPYELMSDPDILKSYSLAELFGYIVKKYGKKRRLIVKVLNALEVLETFDEYIIPNTFIHNLLSIKDNIGKIGAWCDYFSKEFNYYWYIYNLIMKKLKKMTR